MIMSPFVEARKTNGLKVNPDKSKVMAPKGKERMVNEVDVVKRQLEHVREFKSFRFELDELGTDGEKCRMKVETGSKFAGEYQVIC